MKLAIDNAGDYNPVKKVGDKCIFMSCTGRVKFDRFDTMDDVKYIVLTCPKCGVENYKKMKVTKEITHCLSCGEWLEGMAQCSECGRINK